MIRATILLWLAVAAMTAAVDAMAEVCRPAPEADIAAGLLEFQPERAPLTFSTLARYPGAGETFLSALMGWDYLAAGWANPLLGGGASAPAMGTVYNNRNYGYCYTQASTVTVGREAYALYDHLYTSPLILDLDHDGAAGVVGHDWRAHPGIDPAALLAAFDIDGDAHVDVVEWISPGDGLLVCPVDATSVVDGAGGLTWVGPLSGRDLLGTADGFLDGFAELAWRRDTDGDRMITGTELDGLYVWQDLDADARIQPGELHKCAQLGITTISLPAAGECTGSFADDGSLSPVWDWWPSFARASRVWQDGMPDPLSMIPLPAQPLPDLSHPGPMLPLSSSGWVSADALAAAGLDLATARLVGLSPSGDVLVIHDRATDPAEIGAGRVRRLWLLTRPAGGSELATRILPLPVTDVLQFAFGLAGEGYLVADGGSRLLRVDLASAALTSLHQELPGAAGFQFGDEALRTPAGIHFWGRFHNADGADRGEVVAALVTNSREQSLIHTVDRAPMLTAVAALGTIAGEMPVTPELSHFVVLNSAGLSQLVTYEGGRLLVIDTQVLPTGLAASGNRVLYFRQSTQGDTCDVCVADIETGRSWTLGTGDFCYPYLVAGGSLAVVASIDWAAGTMTLWTSPVHDGAHLAPTVTLPGVAAVRVTEDGSRIISLGADGLHLSRDLLTTAPDVAAVPPRLLPTYPNPFNAAARIAFELPAPAAVELSLHDAAGRLVRVLASGEAMAAGPHAVTWDGRDAAGRDVASGVYFCRLVAGAGAQTGRLVLVR